MRRLTGLRIRLLEASTSRENSSALGTDGGEQLRRTILIEPKEPRKEVEEKPENHHNTSSNGLQHHSIPSQPYCNNSASV
nr:unnamed protein product [Haemonchus contortus]